MPEVLTKTDSRPCPACGGTDCFDHQLRMKVDTSSQIVAEHERSGIIENPEIEIIEGSARQTTELAIRRRQLLAQETASISDLALRLAVAFTAHRTCFRQIGRGYCSGCEDTWQAGLWIDIEMDHAGIPRDTRKLPYPTRQEHE